MTTQFDLDSNIVRCVVNDSEPSFQPNVYDCPDRSSCCFYHGEASCCGSDATLKQFLNQMWPYLVALMVLLFFCKSVSWVFAEDDIEEEDYVFQALDVKKYKKYMLAEPFETIVDDPIFGRCIEERAPRLSAGGGQQREQK